MMRSPNAYLHDVAAAYRAGTSRERTRQAHVRATRAYAGLPPRRSPLGRIARTAARVIARALLR